MKKMGTFKLAVGTIGILILSVTLWQVAYTSTNPRHDSVASLVSGVVKNISTNTNGEKMALATQAKEFTAEELAAYNGKDGNSAYVAMDGVVYDLTALGAWRGGQHHGISAGTDITLLFSSSPHAKSILTMGEVVGKLVDVKSVLQSKQVANLESEPVTNQLENEVEVISSATVAMNSETVPQSFVASPGLTQQVATTTDWTLSKLALYNGKNGQPSYIAVGGTIYDVTNVAAWSEGTHHGLTAGQDLTAAFASSPHSMAILDLAKVVGKLSTATAKTSVTTTTPATTPVNSITTVTQQQSTQEKLVVAPGTTAGWTLDVLAMYNGKNGQPSYIAVGGTIYDVTNVSAWQQGTHHGVSAGQDLTTAFATSPHSMAILDMAKVVGKLTTSSATTAQTVEPTSTGWTLGQLALYNGKNGQPSYIAVSGTIYDVTNVNAWSEGTHQGLTAGQDLTAAFAGSPHSMAILDMATVVGKLDPSISTIAVLNTTSKDDDMDEDDHEEDDHEEDDHEEDDHQEREQDEGDDD